ncbi:MAG: zf-HC2 domain-containing protein [Anaerolineae bacterium]|jgi:hypothetical protein|nr:zf-HC2 domain-containing protein [Anaerolineae bacterium]MBT4312652.1 zf-HC2 domain-containing protein [Anaerolineae bacterium]MBT4459395.1 zf-HC2 domain-containing protein [Anaerolineae bacterium]MBT6061061.1 zf-HC2 domain-containing protein [Anaerolineae bacterium]MBT6322962.1 zf-HC2 domain-containing protein [Anaerolineae bacterium]
MNHLNEIELNEYLDQMLDKATQKKVEAHLADCEKCRAQVNDLKTLFSTLDELPEIPLTRNLTPNILVRLPKPIRIPVLWKEPAFLIQSVLTIILLALGIPILSTKLATLLPAASYITLRKMLIPFFAWDFSILFTMPELTFSMPTLPTVPVSSDVNALLMLALSASILWGIGNYSLLKSKPEIQG